MKLLTIKFQYSVNDKLSEHFSQMNLIKFASLLTILRDKCRLTFYQDISFLWTNIKATTVTAKAVLSGITLAEV